MLNHFADDPDIKNGLIDSTIVRAHPCAAGAQKSGGQANQALGLSCGGFSTKIHVTVDGLGNPLRLRLTTGQQHDISQSAYLITGFNFEHVIVDRGYAAEDYVELVIESNAEPVIPPHLRAIQQREYDTWLYRERPLGECFINKIKHFRRVFSRFDILASRYPDSVQFVSALLWLR